ncbi:MAG: DEAD/DEAH box helicase [Limnohabitans sp.]|jgi:ATP-dependent RNA helicase DeaD|nr:DEAD/DEAH box helicase [Limnohabitans sp.]
MSDNFEALGFGPEILAELAGLGYEEPTPIQRAAAGPLLEGRDLLGQAATGTGKTAAFALPLLQRVAGKTPTANQPLVLVLVPTRELAMQVSEAFHRYGRGLGISVAPIYGGQDFRRQIIALRRGVHVVVATPGRILDHMRRETIDLAGVMSVVLDEADEMLDMGFAEDLELILEALPETRQTALFSATLPPRIAGIAERHLREPERVLIPRDPAASGTAPKVRQMCYIVPRAHKIAALGRVLDIEAPTLAIIFCRTRIEVAELAERLVGRGYSVEALHGGMTQAERDRVMKKARAATVDLLVATDVAARGIDIEHISHVVNFDVPSSPEAYTHRIGRTGRAGREGVAITLAEPREHRLVRNIEWITKSKIEIGVVPTVHDIKSHRLDLTKGALREVLAEAAESREDGASGELDGFRTVVESLAGEFDPMDVAAAAVKLAHEASAGTAAEEDEVHIPSYESFARPKNAHAGGRRFDDRGDRSGAYRGGSFDKRESRERPMEERPVYTRPVEPRGPARDVPRDFSHGERSQHDGREPRGKRGSERHEADLVRVYIAAGRRMGMRPADLVGAIANEARVNPRGIGAIEIADGFSIVELPERDAERVIEALKGATLRGRRVTVRRDDGRRRAR